MPTTFLFNRTLVTTDLPPGAVVLDYIRGEARALGTKIGCREGDCGACTVLVGSLEGDRVAYKTMTSCLMPIGNAAGKHIVTIEGLNPKEAAALTPVQQAMVDESGAQCGFCTVGFVMSLSAHAMARTSACGANSPDAGIAAVDGNICRCTGYKAIERAIKRIDDALVDCPAENAPEEAMDWLIEKKFAPDYFGYVPERLRAIADEAAAKTGAKNGTVYIGGGTDLLVQRPEEISARALTLLYGREEDRSITSEDGKCKIGAAATMTDFMESETIRAILPQAPEWMKLVASTPIRNMATLAGNIVNASPIGDMTILLLALDAALLLKSAAGGRREVSLRNFYKGYRQIDLREGERVESIEFAIPPGNARVNFEKVSKRRCLDIASVNSAARIEMEGDLIRDAIVSAGGVGPTPRQLPRVMAELAGQPLAAATIRKAAAAFESDISPIMDARGSAEYKRLLLRQLFFAHFLRLFPNRFSLRELA